MKQYKDLNLKKIRDEFGLDFAHFTYQKGMCSCCCGPEDLPKKYWKDGIVKDNNYSYILFKNADNGSGVKTRNDVIEDYTCIEWEIPDSVDVTDICRAILNQLDGDYCIEIPKTKNFCIVIRTTESILNDVDLRAQTNLLFYNGEVPPYIFGDYVLTPIKNAFNNKTSYWLSKKGCTKAIYCFSDPGAYAVSYHIRNIGSYVRLFDDTFKT